MSCNGFIKLTPLLEGMHIQSISVAFEHCILRDHVWQELSVGGASRKWHSLEYASLEAMQTLCVSYLQNTVSVIIHTIRSVQTQLQSTVYWKLVFWWLDPGHDPFKCGTHSDIMTL